jgi:hypothetical protein
LCAALVSAAALAAAPGAAAAAQPFTFLAPGFTQELYGTGLPFAAGVAFAPNGDPVLAFGSFFRFDSHSTTTVHGSAVHPLTTHQASLSLGLANSPDGSLYANTGGGVEKIDPTTGAPLAGPAGDGGDGLGIEFDPMTGKLVYGGGPGLAVVAPTLDPSTAGTFSSQTTSDGLVFSPKADFAFAADDGINEVDATGALVQHIADTTGHCCADGMAFHASPPQFLLSNNTDGSITRYDFPNDDFTKAPTQSNFADGGFRGDLTDVGGDGCLYLTQGGTRFADGTETGDGSLVRLCGGFAPPVPVTPTLVANPSVAQILPGLTAYLKLSARLSTSGGTGVPNETISFSAGGKNVCSAKTDATGTAACGGVVAAVQSVLSLGYTASFAGDGNLQPVSAKGPLVIVNGIKLP